MWVFFIICKFYVNKAVGVGGSHAWPWRCHCNGADSVYVPGFFHSSLTYEGFSGQSHRHFSVPCSFVTQSWKKQKEPFLKILTCVLIKPSPLSQSKDPMGTVNLFPFCPLQWNWRVKVMVHGLAFCLNSFYSFMPTWPVTASSLVGLSQYSQDLRSPAAKQRGRHVSHLLLASLSTWKSKHIHSSFAHSLKALAHGWSLPLAGILSLWAL